MPLPRANLYDLLTSELESEMISGANCTSRTAAAAADGEGYATRNVVAVAAADCRVVQHLTVLLILLLR